MFEPERVVQSFIRFANRLYPLLLQEVRLLFACLCRSSSRHLPGKKPCFVARTWPAWEGASLQYVSMIRMCRDSVLTIVSMVAEHVGDRADFVLRTCTVYGFGRSANFGSTSQIRRFTPHPCASLSNVSLMELQSLQLRQLNRRDSWSTSRCQFLTFPLCCFHAE